MARGSERSRRSLPRRLWWLWIGIIVIAGGIALSVRAFLQPDNLREVVIEVLEERLAAEVEVGSCAFSFAGGISVRDLRLRDAASGEELLRLPRVTVVPRYLSLLAGRLTPREVVCEAPVVSISRAADGRWSIADILQRDAAPQTPSGTAFVPFPLRISGGTVRYRDVATFESPLDEELTEVNVELRPSGDGVRIGGELSLAGLRRLSVEGRLDPAGDLGWVGEIAIEAARLDLAQRAASLRRLLPASFAALLESARPSGFVNAEATWRIGPGATALPARAALSFVGCQLESADLPWDLQDLGGTLAYADRRLAISRLAGRVDGAPFSADGEIRFAGAENRIEKWSGTARFKDVRLDERVRSVLPERWQTRYDEYRPSGVVSVEARVAESSVFPPHRDDVVVEADLERVGFDIPSTPFHPTGVEGAVRIERGRLVFTRPLEGRLRGTRFTVATGSGPGGGVSLERGGAVDVTLRAFGMPLDEDIRKLLPEKGQRIWDFFSLVGTADVTANLSRPASDARAFGPEEPLRIVAEALPREARIRWVDFPYEVTDISGAFSFDSSTLRLAFFDLEGRHGEQTVTAEGVVEFGNPVVLKIMLHSPSLEVDDDLKAALDPEARALVEQFGFDGRLRTDVSIHSTALGGVEVVTELEIIDASVRPAQFPYELALRGGRLKLTGHDAIELDGVRTVSGTAPFIELSGDLLMQGSERWLSFNFDVEDLPFDDKLRAALPPDLRRFAENFGLGGVFRGQIEGDYRFDSALPDSHRVIYRAKNLRSENASVDFGIKISNMSAVGGFVGRSEPGKPGYFQGDVRVASARFNRLRLTNGAIEFAYGTEHPLIAAARSGARGPESGYLPPRFIVERLKEPRDVANAFQMVVHSPDLYGGTLDGFLWVDTGERGDLGGEVLGSGLQISEAAMDVFGTEGSETAGDGFGRVWFTGETGDLASLIGEGSGGIKEAKLVELPLFLGILSLIFGESSTRHFFNDVAVAFKLAGGKFVAPSDGIDIRSNALILRGGGSMDFSGSLDLTLEPRLFGFEIPIVEQFLYVLKKGIAQVWVTGDLAKPKVQFVTGAGAVRIGLDMAEEKSDVPLPSDLREREAGKEGGRDGVEQ